MSYEVRVEILKALADPTRLSILQKIATSVDPVPTCDLVVGCSSVLQLSQPTMSHHINKLVHSKVLVEQKQAKFKTYALNKELFAQLGIDIHTLIT